MKLILSLLGLFVIFISAPAQEHPSTRDGVYTADQASRGKASYQKACVSCHRETLMGAGAATPPLVGPDFTAKWEGQPLGDLFEQMQTSMPADRPGKLARTENANILAYILQVNKLPAGDKELPNGADALKRIQFEAAK